MSLFTKSSKPWNEYLGQSRDTDISKVGDRVKERLRFLAIGEDTLAQVREAAVILAPYQAELVNRFYESITAVDHLKKTIERHSTLERLRGTMERYIGQFLRAEVDQEYIATRTIVGHVHSRISLTADHFISAHHLIIQMMTAILMEKLRRRPDDMMRAVIAVQKLGAFDQQLIVEVYMEETFKSFLFGVSGTLNDMTQLDTTKQLIRAMGEQIGESHSVTAATEQMSASIQEVADQAVNVAERTDDAVKSAEQGKLVIGNALQDIRHVGQVYNDVVAQITELNQHIEKTQGVVGIIRDIADQTNLLALNASIEAARAGEFGSGFGVVASEIRKLSEHTKEQIAQIKHEMESLHEVARHVTGKVSETGRQVEQSVDGAQSADEALESIVATLHEISHSTTQIAAMTEEQTSTVTDIAHRNSVIFDLSSRSEQIAKETSKMVFDLSVQMDEYRKSFFTINVKLNAKDIVKVAKTDHLLWKWKIYNMLLGLDNLSPEAVSSHQLCRLGQWYYGELPSVVKNSSAYIELEKPHKAVHDYAKQAAKCYEAGDIAGAEESFVLLQQASSQVISLLARLESEL